MARFGDLEAAIMDIVWAAGAPVRVREVSDRLNRAGRWRSTRCRP